MGNLLGLYAALAVFGAGVTVIDFLGLLGHDHADGGEGAAHDGDDGVAGGTLAAGNTGIRALTRVMGALRTAVYFALGAGPTGLVAALLGQTPRAGLAWALAMGAGVAVLGRLLRALVRRDLDSSIKPEELLMERARVTVPMDNGELIISRLPRSALNWKQSGGSTKFSPLSTINSRKARCVVSG